jgi:phage I-like protein
MTPEQIQALTQAMTAAIASGFEALSAKLPTAPVAEPKSETVVAPNAVDAIKVAVNAVVDAAVSAGKIAPASKDQYVVMGGESADSLKNLQTLVSGLPVIVATNAALPKPAGSDKPALTAQQTKVCRELGITEDQFRAQKGELG